MARVGGGGGIHDICVQLRKSWQNFALLRTYLFLGSMSFVNRTADEIINKDYRLSIHVHILRDVLLFMIARVTCICIINSKTADVKGRII